MSTLVFIKDDIESTINAFCDLEGLDNEEVIKSIKGIILNNSTYGSTIETKVNYYDTEFNFYINGAISVYNHSSEFMGNDSIVLVLSSLEYIKPD
jgi:hypothetical protein